MKSWEKNFNIEKENQRIDLYNFVLIFFGLAISICLPWFWTQINDVYYLIHSVVIFIGLYVIVEINSKYCIFDSIVVYLITKILGDEDELENPDL